ncbi:MAG: hypothetical protein ACYCXW_23030 [Solirubrobacteraceae bacterium]
MPLVTMPGPPLDPELPVDFVPAAAFSDSPPPALEPDWLGDPTKEIVAALVGLVLPAASVSHTARVHVPAPGTVTVAGPSGGAVTAGWHSEGYAVEQTW